MKRTICLFAKNRRKFAAPARSAGVLSPLTALAHPGHGLAEESVSHYLTSPFHLAVLLALGCALMIAARFVTHATAKKVLLSTGTVAVVTALAVWGIRA